MQELADTIFALSSGAGRAGVAVLRVTGRAAGEALVTLAGPLPEARQAAVRTLRAPGSAAALDRALVLWFPAPASFTGEDMVELHVHGGRAVIGSVVAALAACSGLRAAEPGEFTRRAFENGKLDLVEVEGLADLINAETEAQRRQAYRQMRGGLSDIAEGWRSDLVDVMARVESALDFSDEGDVPDAVLDDTTDRVARLRAAIAGYLADDGRGERLRDGYRVALAGPPNVGKSSLLNALARRDVAIVSEEPGTTRDVIEVHLDLGGLPVMVSDTAGIRAAEGGIEAEGIRRTLARSADSDIVLWLVDATSPLWDPPEALAGAQADLVRVINKIDLRRPGTAPKRDVEDLEISARTEEGLDRLTDRLRRLLMARVPPPEAPAITRARHRRALEDCGAALSRFLDGPAGELELRAEDLRQAAHALGRLTGRVDVEDVLGRIFSEFCIGK